RPTGTGTPQEPPLGWTSAHCRAIAGATANVGAGPPVRPSAALGGRLGGRRPVLGLVAVLGIALGVTAGAALAQALVEDAGDGLLGALGQLVGLVGGGDLVVGVLVVAVLAVDAVGDAVGLVLVEAGVGHGVDDVTPLGVVVRAGREPEDDGGGERGEL